MLYGEHKTITFLLIDLCKLIKVSWKNSVGVFLRKLRKNEKSIFFGIKASMCKLQIKYLKPTEFEISNFIS